MAAHIPKVQNVRTKIPMVEVTAPDGGKSLWVAAVAKADAVAAVEGVIPGNYVAALSQRRLTLTRKSDVLRRGEVRRVKAMNQPKRPSFGMGHLALVESMRNRGLSPSI